MTGVPLLTTWYKGHREQYVFKRMYNSAMVRGERVIAVSDQIAEIIAERHHVAPERIAIIPAIAAIRSAATTEATNCRRTTEWTSSRPLLTSSLRISIFSMSQTSIAVFRTTSLRPREFRRASDVRPAPRLRDANL